MVDPGCSNSVMLAHRSIPFYASILMLEKMAFCLRMTLLCLKIVFLRLSISLRAALLTKSSRLDIAASSSYSICFFESSVVFFDCFVAYLVLI